MSAMSERQDLAPEGLPAPIADAPSPHRRAAGRDGRKFAAEWQLALPLGAFYLAFLFAPIGALFLISLFTDGSLTRFGPDQYIAFFSERLSYIILLDTLRLGFLTTAACLVLAFPLALAYMKLSERWRAAMMFLVVLPQLTSAVVRTFAWIVILGREGIINNTLLALGLSPVGLLYTTMGVVIALVQIQLPLMTLPLINALARLDPQLLEASDSLGAGVWRGFRKITLPMTLPAIMAGSLLVFATSISAFVTQSIIGGGRLTYMPKYIYDLSMGAQNWPFAAAATIVLLASVLTAVTAFTLAGQASLRRVEG
jgi:putative spermidine/putrescine transport system permease protein